MSRPTFPLAALVCLAVAPLAAADPSATTQTGLDANGDPLPDGALARFGTVRWRHARGIGGLAFSPDGRVLASAGRDSAVRLWSFPDGRPLHALAADGAVYHAPAFSPDGTTLAVARAAGGGSKGRATVELYDARTYERRRVLDGHGSAVRKLRFSADGKVLHALARDRAVTWDLGSGRVADRRELDPAMVSPDLRPDGCLAWSSNADNKPRVYLRKLGAGEATPVELPEYERPVRAVAFAPDGAALAVAPLLEPIAVRDLTAGHNRLRIEPGSTVTRLAFSPDGQLLASAGLEGEVCVWDGRTGALTRKFAGPRSGVSALAFSPDGRHLAACDDESTSIKIWDVRTGRSLTQPPGHTGGVDAVAFLPGGAVVTAAARDARRPVRLWDVRTGGQTPAVRARGIRPFRIAATPDGGRLVVACEEHPVPLLLDAATGEYLTGPDHFGEIRAFDRPFQTSAVAVSPDGAHLAAGGMAGQLHLCRLGDGRRVWSAAAHGDAVAAAAFSPDGKLLATGGRDRSVALWGPATGKLLHRFPDATAPVTSLRFSPDGRHLAALDGDLAAANVRVWRLNNHTLLRRFSAGPCAAADMAFSPDGRTVALAGGDGVVRLYEVGTGRERHAFAGHGGPVAAVAFAPDGRALLSAAADGTALLWDLTHRGRNSDNLLSVEEAGRLWEDLGGADAGSAHLAMWRLVHDPALAEPFLLARLAAQPAATAGEIEGLIDRLGHDSYPVRVRAAHRLAGLGAAARPALERRLRTAAAAEVRAQVAELLAHLDGVETLTPGQLQALRAEEALDWIRRLRRDGYVAADAGAD